MDNIKQLELLEEALDCLLELQALTCYDEGHFRASINSLRSDIIELL